MRIVKCFLGSEKLKCESELQVLTALLNWLNYDDNTRKLNRLQLLKIIADATVRIYALPETVRITKSYSDEITRKLNDFLKTASISFSLPKRSYIDEEDGSLLSLVRQDNSALEIETIVNDSGLINLSASTR